MTVFLTLFIPCILIELNCSVMTPSNARLIYTKQFYVAEICRSNVRHEMCI
jgi:hypothetical protein